MNETDKSVYKPDVKLLSNKMKLESSNKPGLSLTVGLSQDDKDNFNIILNLIPTRTARWPLHLLRKRVYDKDFSVVLSENDNMAIGAIEAMGKQGEIAVFGIDGDIDALRAVRDGRMEGTVYHNALKIAQTLYDFILKLKTFETVEPVYMIPFEPVGRENVEHYIREVERETELAAE